MSLVICEGVNLSQTVVKILMMHLSLIGREPFISQWKEQHECKSPAVAVAYMSQADIFLLIVIVTLHNDHAVATYSQSIEIL